MVLALLAACQSCILYYANSSIKICYCTDMVIISDWQGVWKVLECTHVQYAVYGQA